MRAISRECYDVTKVHLGMYVVRKGEDTDMRTYKSLFSPPIRIHPMVIPFSHPWSTGLNEDTGEPFKIPRS